MAAGAMQGLEWLGTIAQDAIEKRRAALGRPVINWKDILERCISLRGKNVGPKQPGPVAWLLEALAYPPALVAASSLFPMQFGSGVDRQLVTNYASFSNNTTGTSTLLTPLAC